MARLLEGYTGSTLANGAAGQTSIPNGDGRNSGKHPPTELGTHTHGEKSSESWQCELRKVCGASNGYEVEWLIQSVPDPLTTDLSLFTDAALDALLQATTALGFNLDRYDLPWELEGSDARHVRAKADADSRVGIVLLRQPADHTVANAAGRDRILVVLVVRETPTAGVDMQALAEALDVAWELKKQSSPIRVQGPFFSGSSESMRRAVMRWWEKPNLPHVSCQRNELLFVSGSAMADSNKGVLSFKAHGQDRANVLCCEFAATTLPINKAIDLLREKYLMPRGIPDSETAFLSESDTVYGASPSPAAQQQNRGGEQESDGSKGASDINVLRFPMHIGSMRSAYAQDTKLFLDKNDHQQASPRLSLDLSLQSSGEPRHLLPLLAPATINQIESSLISELKELYRRRLRVAIIVATDPRDQVFMAQLVKTHAPHTLVILMAADSLFAHDVAGVNIDDVLIASTYPLAARVQEYAVNPAQRHGWVVFRNQHAEGVYNATIALIGNSIKDGVITAPDALRDYYEPFGTSAESVKPPLWVTTVRHNVFWPIACLEVNMPAKTYTLLAAAPEARARADKSVREVLSREVLSRYDPGHHIAFAIVGLLFSAWAIYRCLSYLSFEGWVASMSRLPALAVSSLWELAALSTVTGLLLVPIALHANIVILNGEMRDLRSFNWSWCACAVVLVTTFGLASYVALVHGSEIILYRRGRSDQRPAWVPLAVWAAMAMPLAALFGAISCIQPLTRAMLSCAEVVFGLLACGVSVRLLSDWVRRRQTKTATRGCWPRVAAINVIFVVVLWMLGVAGGAHWWIVVLMMCLCLCATTLCAGSASEPWKGWQKYCLAGLCGWTGVALGLLLVAVSIRPEEVYRQAPFTCDRMYYIVSGVSPLTPLILLCLAVALVARGCFQRALLSIKWGDLNVLQLSATSQLQDSLNGGIDRDKYGLALRCLKWGPLVALVIALLANYWLHSVTTLDSDVYKWLVFGIICVMALVMVVLAGRFYDLAFWLLRSLKLLATEPIADALRPGRIPMKLCKEVERLFLSTEPELLDIGSRALELRSLIDAAEPHNPKARSHLFERIMRMVNRDRADRNIGELDDLHREMIVAYTSNSDAVHALWDARKSLVVELATRQSEREPNSIIADIKVGKFAGLRTMTALGRAVVLEDFMAMMIVMQIRTALCCLRKLLYSAFAVGIAIALAVEAYPFLPRGPLAMAALSVPLLAFSWPLMRLFIELSKDRMISQICGSEPQKVEFSGASLLNIALLLGVPVLSALVYQFPAIAKPLYELRDVISQVHK